MNKQVHEETTVSEAMLFKRPDGVVRKVDGYLFEEPKGAKTFASKLDKLPDTVDLRGQLSPVQDDGSTRGCVAYAVATAFEHLTRRARGDTAFAASRLFVYYNARRAAGNEEDDAGCTIASALDALKEHGACSNRKWPFDASHVLTRPPDEAYEEAKGFALHDAELVPVELSAWKQALAEGHPIVFGMYLFSSFDKQRQPGLVPVPSDSDLEGDQGEHALLCVGYSEGDEVFIVRNCWGPAWGDQGYCYIPFAYMMDAELNRGDAWILRGPHALSKDASTWSNASVIDDVETPLGAMDDEAWGALLDSLGDVALETRLALIFLAAAEEDADVSEATLSSMASSLDDAFQQLGCPFEADRVLRQAVSLVDEGALIDDSIVLMGEHFEEEALAAVVRAAAEGAGVDDLSGAEEGTLADLVDAWLGGAAPREGGLVDGLPGEYDSVDYAGGVYDDDDDNDDGGFGDGFGEMD